MQFPLRVYRDTKYLTVRQLDPHTGKPRNVVAAARDGYTVAWRRKPKFFIPVGGWVLTGGPSGNGNVAVLAKSKEAKRSGGVEPSTPWERE